MQIEFEATFTGVDKDAVRAALAKAGGTLVKKESFMRPFFEILSHHLFGILILRYSGRMPFSF